MPQEKNAIVIQHEKIGSQTLHLKCKPMAMGIPMLATILLQLLTLAAIFTGNAILLPLIPLAWYHLYKTPPKDAIRTPYLKDVGPLQPLVGLMITGDVRRLTHIRDMALQYKNNEKAQTSATKITIQYPPREWVLCEAIELFLSDSGLQCKAVERTQRIQEETC